MSSGGSDSSSPFNIKTNAGGQVIQAGGQTFTPDPGAAPAPDPNAQSKINNAEDDASKNISGNMATILSKWQAPSAIAGLLGTNSGWAKSLLGQ